MIRNGIAVALLCACTFAISGEPASEVSLTPKAMLELAPQPRAQFVREWDARRVRAIAALADDAARADAITRLQFQHAQGRVMYPFFHWRESDARQIEPDPDLARVIAALPPIDARLWEFGEVRDYVDARLQASAREHLAGDADLARGDARWLRAKLRALDEVLADPALWMRKATDLIAQHVDDDGAAGIEQAKASWRAKSPSSEARQRIDQAIAADRAHATGVRTFEYREVGGVPLRLYVQRPANAPARHAPAMLWLHGGSATEGTWWHSPVTTRALLEGGITVIAVELTTGNRFDRDADQVTDAAAAFDFVRAHARTLGVDPRRIGVAGFSSGASLALLLATRGAAPASADPATAARSARPAAVIVSGACADPLSAGSDGYFRKSVGATRDPADLSPIARIRRGGPPILAIHGTADEFCPHADMARFAGKYRESGGEIMLVSVEGAPHFFGFFHQEGQRLQAAAIAEALRRWEWYSRARDGLPGAA
jgi:acetyl esterase